MSENDSDSIRNLAVSVGKLEVSVTELTKKVESIEKKIDESKKRFSEKYLFPVMATVSAAIIIYLFTNFMNFMKQAMEVMAKAKLTP